MLSLTPIHRVLAVSFWLLIAFVVTGCHRDEPIVTYSIPTTVPIQLRAANERMLAAMVPHGDLIWFFKVTGPEAAIARIEPEFKQFVTNAEFDGTDPKLDNLPQGWQRAGEKAMRFASIDILTPEKQLDLSISNLARGGEWDEQVTMNVNRWRGQLGLEPSSETWAEGIAMDVHASDGKSVWVDLVGKPGGGSSMSSPPFAGMDAGGAGGSMPPMSGSPKSGPATPGSTASDASPAEPPLKFEMPAGWRSGKMSMMRWAAFDAGPEDAPAELTVMPAGGNLRDNVARWIGQVRPSGAGDKVVDEAMAAAQKIEVDGRPAQRFLLQGEEADNGTAIDATIIPLSDGMSLFVKMTGPAKTVADQSEAIAEFLRSLKL